MIFLIIFFFVLLLSLYDIKKIYFLKIEVVLNIEKKKQTKTIGRDLP